MTRMSGRGLIVARRSVLLAGVAAALWVGPAGAQSVYTGVPAPDAGAADAGGSGAQLRAQSQRTSGAGDGLAVTGTDVVGLVAIGGGAIAIGSFLKRRADA